MLYICFIKEKDMKIYYTKKELDERYNIAKLQYGPSWFYFDKKEIWMELISENFVEDEDFYNSL